MKRPCFLSAFVAGLTLCSIVGAQETPTLETILARARAARCEPLRCKGSADCFQAKHQFDFVFDNAGRFEFTLSGPFGRTSGFDGRRAWQVDERAGIPYDLDLYLGDECRASHSIWIGEWCSPSFGFSLEKPRNTGDGIAVTLRSPRSTYTATLTIDRKTFQPQSLVPTGWGIADTIRYSDYADGLARRIERENPAGNVDVLLVESVEPGDRDATCGSRPIATPRNVQFDTKTDTVLEVKQARTGHLLVRPKVNGVQVGWFMFDSGAPITTISAATAEQLGLDIVGHSYIGGAGSELKTVPVHRAASLELGPIRLENLRLTQFDTIGSETVGVIGWDVLIHSVVEIDMKKAAIAIHPRDGYELPAGEWRDMVLHMQHPHVEASFVGDHKGLFRIDTGAGHVSVMFHKPTVDKLDMLADRETTPLRARGAGGPLNLRIGPIEWFEIAGHRTEQPQAIFCLDEVGALADDNSFGNLGGGVLTPFILVFDYQGKRVGFVPRDEVSAGR